MNLVSWVCGQMPLRSRVSKPCGWRGAVSPAGRSPRTKVHRRAVLVLPLPGASTGIGVLSARSFDAASRCRRIASTNGAAMLWPR